MARVKDRVRVGGVVALVLLAFALCFYGASSARAEYYEIDTSSLEFNRDLVFQPPLEYLDFASVDDSPAENNLLVVDGGVQIQPSAVVFDNIEDAAAVVRSGMVARDSVVGVCFNINCDVKSDDINTVFNQIIREIIAAATNTPTGVGCEGDYLALHLKNWVASGTVSSSGGYYLNTYYITYSFEYYSTADQELEVTSKVGTILNSFGWSNTTGDYKKICDIYGWVCNNVSYDFDGLYDANNTLKFSAYAALFEGKCVCQGFSTLLYRLCLDAGLDCRVVRGCNNGSAHCWNIVKLDDEYYWLDPTWDCGKTFDEYSWFLRGGSVLDQHIASSEYSTDAWRSTYSMGKTDYQRCVRLAGDDRYKTMNKVDGEVFESGSAVVLTCGGNFPDSLTAAGLAGVYGCPIILTDSGVLSSEAAAEIERLGAHTVYIVGGENSISVNIENTLVGQGLTVNRIAGADRYETARAVYGFSAGSWGISGYGSKTAIIAAGTTFADSLSASSYAWWSTSPIFLVNSNGIDAATADAIISGEFERIVIVGGTASVPTSVEVWASSVAKTLRISGNDRYETSTKFAEWAYTQGMSFNNSSVSTGKNYPDALCGGALCGKCGSVMLLADDSNTSAVDVVSAHRDEISRMYFLGGVNSVSSEVFDLFVSALS